MADEFEGHRERLTAVAARVLGSRADAEDVVQEAWLRFARQEPGSIDNVAAWLTTVVGRLSIDHLRSRSAKAEVPFTMPVAVVADDDPEGDAIRAEALGLALLTVLGSLRPDERIAFVLHDLFAMPFAEIGPVIGRSADAAKMTASRARRKVRGAATGPAADRRRQRAVVEAFLAAARDGDFAALLEVLDPDVIWETHGARAVTVRTGSAEVVRAVERGGRTGFRARRVLVDGQAGILAWNPAGQPVGLMRCTVENGRMTRITSLTDRSRLAALELPPPPAAA
ncbi:MULTISPECIES: sigma-70 family RNA polymerase sigma factor [Actinoplanes]|uniref:sigma-70 family RNA polymerase sigma factor n=1 Tax=Actinoplanes TaxID=1865 RepID=UPI0005F2F12F|nr:MULTISPECIES: sigma-70 family RNA polymerase sigma factor [Actinoplanes]GLY07013.1 DNA-directed RNA polymerase sigma-70 factor [Actinoplanes sp. NBRC 101535]